MKLIQPFKWLLPYVPLLPNDQLEYIEAPHPFIMGYNSEFITTVDQVRPSLEKTQIIYLFELKKKF